GDPLGQLETLVCYPPYVLVDADIAKALGELVQDNNTEVSRAALDILWDGGLAARVAAPQVLDVVRGRAGDDLRVRAARVLARIADYALLPKIKDAAKTERSRKVRQALEETIKFIEDL